MVESETKGKFIELSNEIAKRSGFTFKFDISSPKRTVTNFAEKKSQCFFPALDVVLPGPVEKSETVYMKRDFIYMKAPLKVIKLNDLEGKKVGLTLGYPYSSTLTSNTKINFDFAPSDELNVKKLKSGRMDYFIVEEKSGNTAVSSFGDGQIKYDPSSPISQQDVYYACHDAAIALKISNAIKEMKADGFLSKIFSN
ncbi:MAG: transporter substrate-binding domain-containing protein [Halobacteriovoraceae bacterium]|nr:transporter substrate-binding domain-containing protein [Halobacteriovoraceae bacterium]